MLKYFITSLILFVILVIVVAGWRGHTFTRPPIELFPDMKRQPRVDAQTTSDFFGDGRAARLPVEGTVPVGFEIPRDGQLPGTQPPADGQLTPWAPTFSVGTDYYNTGRMGDVWGDGIPIEMSEQLMARGQERYKISCAVCHGDAGYGDGVVGEFGMVAIANFHSDRFRDMPDGEIFNTITHGKGTMFAYGDRISVQDRWAIIAYLRALQESQYADVELLAAAQREQLPDAEEAEEAEDTEESDEDEDETAEAGENADGQDDEDQETEEEN